MDKLKMNSQILKLFLIACLLMIAPLLPTSRRSTYLYFIVNILIIVVGSEAGLFSFFLQPPDHNKKRTNSGFNDDDHKQKEYSADQNKVGGRFNKQMVKKSPSTPCIFFIGGGTDTESTAAAEAEAEANDVQRHELGEVSGQELFQKAETFIGNFYKQLKMQREESWKKLSDLYQKAF